MRYEDIKGILDEIGIPYAYHQFREGTGVEPPFICFFYAANDDVFADNVNYQGIVNLYIELYTNEKDFSAEKKIESALKSHGLSYAKEETYVDTEMLYMQVYSMEFVITS